MAVKTKKRIIRSRAFWEDVVAEYKRSGLTQGAFARDTGLNASTLNQWIKRLEREESVQPEFVEVVAAVVDAVRPAPVAPQTPTRLVLGHAALEFADLPPVGYVAALLREVAA